MFPPRAHSGRAETWLRSQASPPFYLRGSTLRMMITAVAPGTRTSWSPARRPWIAPGSHAWSLKQKRA